MLQNFLKDHKELQTPCYVLDVEVLDNLIEEFKSALNRHWPNSMIAYSFKTNSLPWLIKHMRQRGCNAEVVSADEYALAKAVGYTHNQIIYNGPVKSRQSFLESLRYGATVNIDSDVELAWLNELPNDRVYPVGIRVNFDLESMCPGETCSGTEGGRFGFSLETGDLARAIQILNDYKHISLVGLHLHASTNTRSLTIYEALAKKACDITSIFNLKLTYVNIGGGFYGGLPDKPTFDDYIAKVSGILSSVFDKNSTMLVVEPGTSLVSAPFTYITEVIDIKDTYVNRIVTIDGSRMDVDPLMHKTRYLYDLQSTSTSEAQHPKQVICGYTCMENDRLTILENAPTLIVGDRLILRNVGGYTMCLTPLFIRYFPVVYARLGNELIVLRERVTAKDYLSING